MLAFLGGTGAEGQGLALRYALANEDVIIGSREKDKARKTAEKLQALVPNAQIFYGSNIEAAVRGDLIFLTVPYEAEEDLLRTLRDHLFGKIVVNVGLAMKIQDGLASTIELEERSVSAKCQSLIPGSYVVSAFQNISAVELLNSNHRMEGDVIVCSDYKEAKERVMKLVELINDLRAIDGGPLQNARFVEELTVLLVNINLRYKTRSAIKIIGV